MSVYQLQDEDRSTSNVEQRLVYGYFADLLMRLTVLLNVYRYRLSISGAVSDLHQPLKQKTFHTGAQQPLNYSPANFVY